MGHCEHWRAGPLWREVLEWPRWAGGLGAKGCDGNFGAPLRGLKLPLGPWGGLGAGDDGGLETEQGVGAGASQGRFGGQGGGADGGRAGRDATAPAMAAAMAAARFGPDDLNETGRKGLGLG